MEALLDIFNEAQLDICMHDVFRKQMKLIFAEGTSKEKKTKWDFFNKGCIDRVLLFPKNHLNIDRLVKFISGFISTLSDKDMTNVCVHICTRLQSGNKTVRQRCCEIFCEILSNVFENSVEVCCDLLDILTKHLLKRIHDKVVSVRVAALGALKLLQDVDDPNDPVNAAICKVMTTDSTVAVRIAAIETVNLTEQSLTQILYRIRDIKSEVRVAAIKKLSPLPVTKLSSNARAALVRHGLNDRDSAVRTATSEMIESWLKSLNYNITTLIRALNPLTFEDEARILCNFIARGAVSSDDPTSFGTEIKDWSLDAAISPTFLYDVMWTFTLCSHARNQCDVLVAAEIFDTYLPDAVSLCRLIDQLVTVNGVVQCEKKTMTLKYLIKLSALLDPADVGGINQLLSLYSSVLRRSTLPYDLVEETLEAHSKLSKHLQTKNAFFPEEYSDSLFQLAEDIRSEAARDDNKVAEEEGSYSSVERSLQIMHFTLKKMASKPNSSDVKVVSKGEGILPFLITSLQQIDVNIRCISVSCIGLLCMISPVLSEQYRQIIVQVAGGGFEEDMVVCVAVQCLSDICMVHRDAERARCSDYEICNLLSRLLSERESELVRIASEGSAKLLFGGCIRDSPLLAKLLRFFFISDHLDENDDHSADEDAALSSALKVELDGQTKLQQLLTLFIKSFLFSGGRCEELLLEAVPLLVADLTLDIRDGSVELNTMDKIVKHLLDLCYGMDDARAKAAEEAMGEVDGDDGDDGGPQVKKKRTNKSSRVSVEPSAKEGHAAASALGHSGEDLAEKRRVTSCVKQRLFLSLSRDVLKLGANDKATVKEYLRLSTFVADGDWLNTKTIPTVKKILDSIKATRALDRTTLKLLDKLLATCDSIPEGDEGLDDDSSVPATLSTSAQEDCDAGLIALAPGLADLLALQSRSADTDDDGERSVGELSLASSVASSRPRRAAKKQPAESLTPLRSSSRKVARPSHLGADNNNIDNNAEDAEGSDTDSVSEEADKSDEESEKKGKVKGKGKKGLATASALGKKGTRTKKAPSSTKASKGESENRNPEVALANSRRVEYI